MLALLFVLTVLGILLVEIIEIQHKCQQFPGQEMVPDTTLPASR